MAKKKEEIEEMNLSRTDDAGIPYADPNAPAVVKDREANYEKGMEAQADAEERRKIADGIAQEKAQREAKTETPTNVGGVKATTTNQVASPINKDVQQNGAVQPTMDVNAAMSQVNGAIGSNQNIKSATAGIKNYRSAGSTGYDIVGLSNAQDTNSNQNTKSANVSSGTTTQTQKTEFDPNKAAENVAALDPFLEKVDKEGAAKAFLDVYGEKPTPDALNNAAELARKKNKIAVLSESLRVLFDMGAAAGGGNVYKRDQVQKNITETKAELNKEEAKYQDALDKFNQGLLGAKGADLGTKRALMNDAIKAGYSTVSRGENTQTASGDSKTVSNQTTDGTSNTKGTQTTKAQHEQVVNNKEYDNSVAASMAAAGRGEKMVDVINTTVDKNGKVNEKKLYSFTPTQWDAVKSKSTQYIVSDAKLIRNISTIYNVSEDDVRKALVSGYSVTDMIGTKNGTMNYSDFADMVIKNHGTQNERSRQVFNAYSNRQKLTGEYKSGVVDGTTMDFTNNQQPVDNSGVNIPWQPNAGNPNARLDQLASE